MELPGVKHQCYVVMCAECSLVAAILTVLTPWTAASRRLCGVSSIIARSLIARSVQYTSMVPSCTETTKQAIESQDSASSNTHNHATYRSDREMQLSTIIPDTIGAFDLRTRSSSPH